MHQADKSLANDIEDAADDNGIFDITARDTVVENNAENGPGDQADKDFGRQTQFPFFIFRCAYFFIRFVSVSEAVVFFFLNQFIAVHPDFLNIV